MKYQIKSVAHDHMHTTDGCEEKTAVYIYEMSDRGGSVAQMQQCLVQRGRIVVESYTAWQDRDRPRNLIRTQ